MELIVASGIAAMLLVSLASVVMLSTRAMPSEASAAGRATAAAALVGDLRAELQAAERIVAWSERSIAFTLPDRDADGRPERIEYSWSGVPGDPVRRRFGTAAAADVLPDVRRFHLAPQRQVRTERFPATAVESAETLVSVLDTGAAALIDISVELPLLGGLGLRLGGSETDPLPPPTAALTTTSWCGQMLEPSLPPGVVAWRPTRAAVVLQQATLASGQATAELRPPQHGVPGPDVLASVATGLPLVLDLIQWQGFTFTSAPLVPRDEGIALVLRGTTATTADAKHVLWTGDAEAGPNVHGHAHSADGGGSWMRAGGQALEHRVHGRLLESSGHRHLRHVVATGFDLRLDVGPAAPIEASIDLPGRPSLLAGRWRFDLAAGDPTGQDDDGDGVPDWDLRAGGTFDAHASPILDAMPEDPLDTPVVAEMQVQCDADGSAVVLRLDVDHDASSSMPVLLMVQATSARGQVISVFGARDGGLELLSAVRDRPLGVPVTARLIVDPASGGVNIVLDGVDRGTLPIERLAVPPPHRGVSLSLGGSSVAAATVTVRRLDPLP